MSWVHPDRSAEAERKSLVYQFGRIRDLEEPPLEVRKAAWERLLSELPPGPNKRYLNSFDYESTEVPARFSAEMRAVFASLKPDSSPGLPFCYHFSANSEVLEAVDHEELIEALWARVCALKRVGGSETPQELIDLGACDQVRTFIKQELHSAEKAKEGRFRLIMVLSLLDQCIERWLCSGQNRAEISLWETIPCCPGMGLHDEGLEVLRSKMLAIGGKLVSSDVSGFDWQVTETMLLDDARMRTALAGCGHNDAYGQILRARVRCVSRSVIVLSDGSCFHQKRYGVQKSGSYNTSSTNSHMRAALAYMAGASGVLTMGDDAVESFSDVGRSFYERHFPLKGGSVAYFPTDRVEFCSYLFDLRPGAHQPYTNVRWEKQLATLLDKRPANEVAALELISAFANNARHTSESHLADLGVLSASLSRWGWGVAENNVSNGEENSKTRSSRKVWEEC